MASDSLSVTGFLCLGADQAPPDLSTLTAFKRRLIDTGRVGTIEAMLADTVRLAREKRVPFGPIRVMGSVHTVANVMEASQAKRRAARRAQALRGAGISHRECHLAIQDALKKKGGDALINVSCYEKTSWFFFVSENKVVVEGEAVSFDAGGPDKIKSKQTIKTK